MKCNGQENCETCVFNYKFKKCIFNGWSITKSKLGPSGCSNYMKREGLAKVEYSKEDNMGNDLYGRTYCHSKEELFKYVDANRFTDRFKAFDLYVGHDYRLSVLTGSHYYSATNGTIEVALLDPISQFVGAEEFEDVPVLDYLTYQELKELVTEITEEGKDVEKIYVKYLKKYYKQEV